jgi:tetratricopeptide (TPR) repeat protein
LKPEFAKAHVELAYSYRHLDWLAKAVATYKQAIHLSPRFADAHYNLGITYLYMKDRNAALEEYNILKTINPEQAEKLYAEINK